MMTKESGIFLGARLSPLSTHIMRTCAKNAGVPNIISTDDMHITIIYSTEPIGDLPPLQYEKPIFADISRISTLSSRNGNICLVVGLNCEELVKRHYDLKEEYDFSSYPFPNYMCHMTISYDIGDFDVHKFRWIKSEIGALIIVGEYVTAFNPNWTK